MNELLTRLTFPDVWDTAPGVTAEEAAWTMQNLMDTWLEGCEMVSRVGEIVPHLLGVLPSHMLPMEGDSYSGDDYPELYAVLPNNFKVGNTFTLPDMRGRVPTGINPQDALVPIILGQYGGAAQVVLTVANLAQHFHTTQPHSHPIAEMNLPGGFGTFPVRGNLASWVGGTGSVPLHNNANPGHNQDVALPSRDIPAHSTEAVAPSVNNTGSNVPHENMPPYVGVNYAIIARDA